jgi:hypothetical protein
VDEQEAAVGLHHRAHGLSRSVVGGDLGADGDAPVLGHLGGDEADPVDILLAVLLGEPQAGRQGGVPGSVEK